MSNFRSTFQNHYPAVYRTYWTPKRGPEPEERQTSSKVIYNKETNKQEERT